MIKTMLKPPMLELVVELRFFSGESANLIVGSLEKIAKKYNFKNLQNLGFANLPEEIKKQDPNLHYAPWYRILHEDNKHLSCFVGPNIFSISWTRDPAIDIASEYFPGWSKNLSKQFLEIISDVINMKNDFEISFDNVKYRTIDVFDQEGILENSNLTVTLNQDSLITKEMATTIMFKKTDAQLTHNITISNSAQFVSQLNGSHFKGSLIDITTDFLLKKDDTEDNIDATIQYCHDENKKMFSSILKKDYAEQVLGAKYVK